jgi:hypothetical protein
VPDRPHSHTRNRPPGATHRPAARPSPPPRWSPPHRAAPAGPTSRSWPPPPTRTCPTGTPSPSRTSTRRSPRRTPGPTRTLAEVAYHGTLHAVPTDTRTPNEQVAATWWNHARDRDPTAATQRIPASPTTPAPIRTAALHALAATELRGLDTHALTVAATTDPTLLADPAAHATATLLHDTPDPTRGGTS